MAEPTLRPRENAFIPMAKQVLSIPALNIISQNLCGCGIGGRAGASDYYGHRSTSAQEPHPNASWVAVGATASTGAQLPTDGEDRFREFEARIQKLAELLTRLHRSHKLNAPEAADIALLQEFNTSISPTVLLESRCCDYQALSQTPGNANDMARPTISIIGGDFNIAPFPGDCESVSDRAHEGAQLHIIPKYEQALDVRDYAHLKARQLGAHEPPRSYSNPRRGLFMFKVANNVHRPAGTYISRVDLLLIPLSLLNRPNITYVAHDHGSFDHKELRLHIPTSNG
ncbi:hypothetical protein GGI20_004341 [Coemansia sp. BCRC 34301]|nr:hypothetical protein GGI20_004341 [Coemansia sp. BCRC 34301]